MVSLERATRQEAGSAESEVTESLGIIIKTTTQEPKSELKEKKKKLWRWDTGEAGDRTQVLTVRRRLEPGER